MSIPEPNAPCPCGSGFRYADCHKLINEAPAEEVLSVAFKQYADRWAVNAEHYEKQGIYASLAKHLSYHITPSRVLDIGCGRGQGLAALMEQFGPNGLKIIGVDENQDCLAAAADRFRIPPPDVRLKSLSRSDRKYDIDIMVGPIQYQKSLTLVNTDIRRPDRDLDELVAAGAPLDLVSIWFSGTHGAQSLYIENEVNNLSSSSEIRMATEAAAADVAIHLCRKGGVLHVANRAAERSESACHKLIEAEMQQLGSCFGLSLSNLTLFPYVEPDSIHRVAVGRPGEDTSDLKHFVSSAIFLVR